MQLLAHGREVAHRGEQRGDRVARVGGEEAEPAQAGHAIHGGEQLGQPGPRSGIGVGVDVLAEQGHLPDAPVDQAVDVLDDLPHRPAGLATADEGDDAVGAHLVAAAHHRDVGEQPVGGGQRQRSVEVGGMNRLEPGEEPVAVTDVEEVVEIGQLLEQGGAVLHRHAAGHGDGAARPGLFPLAQLAELAVDLLLRVLSDRAGDQHREVGVVQRRVGHEAQLGEALGEHLVVGIVHLAADVPEMDAGGPAEHRHDRPPGRRALEQRDRLEAAGGGAEQRGRSAHRSPDRVSRATKRGPAAAPRCWSAWAPPVAGSRRGATIGLAWSRWSRSGWSSSSSSACWA